MSKHIGLLVSLLFIDSAVAQETEICKSVPTIFKSETTSNGTTLKQSFKNLLCSAEWETYSEVVSAGIDVTIPIYDIPLPLKANYSGDKRRAWQKQFCNSTERSTDYASQGYRAAYEVSPQTGAVWLACVQALQPSTKALACSVQETETSAVFEARWRKSDDEKDDAAPKIKSLTVTDTTCSGGSFAKGNRLFVGGSALLCKGNLNAAPTFVLQTTRGSCVATGALATKADELSGKIILGGATAYRGNRIKLIGGTTIVTNGFNLTFDAKQIDVEGGVKIISFEGGQTEIGKNGRSAGEIKMQADRITGATLEVINFGQDGGLGAKGNGKGPTGPKGPTGVGGT